MKLLNKYPLSLTSNYVSDWGLWEALREIFQNAVDSRSGHFVTYDSNFGILRVENSETKLDKKTLLLGSSSKSSDDGSIGQFGEGYKIALLVLLKRGYEVTINNADVIWVPSFEYSELFGEEVLTISEYEGEPCCQSLEFKIQGISVPEYEELQRKTLHLNYYRGKEEGIDYKETSYGNILLSSETAGTIYVNGLFVCNQQDPYGYDIKPQHLKLDRDRNKVSDWDFDLLKGRMWAEATPTAEVYKKICEDDWQFRHVAHNLNREQKRECVQPLLDEHTEDTIFVDDFSEYSRLSSEGVATKYVTSSVYNMLDSLGLTKPVPEKEIIPPSVIVNDACNAILENINNLNISLNCFEEYENIKEVIETLKEVSIDWR